VVGVAPSKNQSNKVCVIAGPTISVIP